MSDEVTKVGIRDAVKELGWPKTLLLGFQHMFAMFGATILVPILLAGFFHLKEVPVQVTLFFAGVNTLFFHLCTKFKVPAFLGSSFAYLGGFASVAALNSGIYEGLSGEDKLAYACGGIVVAGSLYLVLASIVKAVGMKRVIRFLPPVVTGPIIILIGLSLAPSAVQSASTNWYLAGTALAIIILCNIWGKGMIKILPILLGVVGSYLIALVCHFSGFKNPDGKDILDFTLASQYAAQGISGFISVPKFTVAKFDMQSIMIMAPIAIATIIELIGNISSISATIGKNLFEDPGLERELMGDGIASSISGMFGGPPCTTYGENTSVLELSKVYDAKVVRIAACYAIILSFCPVVAQLIGSVPASIIGGVSFILYGMISAIGIRNLVENHVDFTDSRNLIIAALILVTGLGFKFWNVQGGQCIDGITFSLGGTQVTLTALALASIVGVVANAILPDKKKEE